ncbi:hypothetical protein pdam_00007032, partial [Pocillopora damicornis]
MSLNGAPQQGLAFQQTAPVAPQYPFNTVVTWHSGIWPHKYAGCGSSFADKYRSSPYNFVVTTWIGELLERTTTQGSRFMAGTTSRAKVQSSQEVFTFQQPCTFR